ncbi:S-adenosyl-L-methionine-dependent methyltransferase [Lipomyces oligophaga]|uniref:S-adenosyl-L-methionine-dependent methyltransferase n=1 Tax=Lipomyces oligophaga TaxID=45792 RepID=UPI0034CFB21D
MSLTGNLAKSLAKNKLSLSKNILRIPWFARHQFSSSSWQKVNVMQVFNRQVKQKQRDRAALNPDSSRTVDYIRDEIADRLVERFLLIARHHNVLLDIGSGPGNIERALCNPRENPADTEVLQSRIGRVIMTEMSHGMLYRDADPVEFPFNNQLDLTRVQLDEENLFTRDLLAAIRGTQYNPGLPFSEYEFENTVDTVVSNLSIHWVNDLPGLLSRVKYALKPDGLFIASMIGGDSLFELRTALQIAEMKLYGRAGPRLSPLADIRDMGSLLQNAGFNMITIDVDDLIVGFPDMMALMKDLRDMGESNAVLNRPHYLPRQLIAEAETVYRQMHASDDGSLPATFRILYMIGWKPSENHPRPLERGSAEISLKDALKPNLD